MRKLPTHQILRLTVQVMLPGLYCICVVIMIKCAAIYYARSFLDSKLYRRVVGCDDLMWKLPTHQYLLSSYASRTRSCIYECVVLLANVKAACHLLQVKWMCGGNCIVVLLVPVQSISYQPYKCLWLIIMLWRYTKQGDFLFHPHDKCTAQQERGECTTVSNLRTAWTLLGSELSFTCKRGAQEVCET